MSFHTIPILAPGKASATRALHSNSIHQHQKQTGDSNMIPSIQHNTCNLWLDDDSTPVNALPRMRRKTLSRLGIVLVGIGIAIGSVASVYAGAISEQGMPSDKPKIKPAKGIAVVAPNDVFPNPAVIYRTFGLGVEYPSLAVKVDILDFIGFGTEAPTMEMDGSWSVDSFSEITWLIDFELPGGSLVQMAGSGTTRLIGSAPAGEPRFFQMEMLELNISGSLATDPPTPFMLRESPMMASIGQVTIESLAGGEFGIESFFDVYTELSLDGGQSWTPAVAQVPEPSTFVLIALGLMALVATIQRRRQGVHCLLPQFRPASQAVPDRAYIVCNCVHPGRWYVASVLIISAAFAAAVPNARAAQTIPGVDIIIRKTPGGTPVNVALGQGGLPIVPGDFFGPGSLPFDGPLDIDFGPLLLNRTAASDFEVENLSTIPTQLAQLRLNSVAPIEPLPGFMYDVQIDLAGAGALMLVETNPAADGGGHLVDSFFDIVYQVRFLPRGTTPGGPLAINGTMELEFAASDPMDQIPWTNMLPGGGFPAGGGNFVLGSDGMQLGEFVLRSPDGGFSLPLVTAVPEPATLALLAFGMCGIAGIGRRRRRHSAEAPLSAAMATGTSTPSMAHPSNGSALRAAALLFVALTESRAADVQAATIIQTEPYGAQQSPFDQTLTFNRFDPALGTLNSVGWAISMTTSGGSLTADNDAATAATVQGAIGANITLALPSGVTTPGVPGMVTSNVSLRVANLAADNGDGAGVVDPTAPDGVHWTNLPTQHASASANASVLADSIGISAFIVLARVTNRPPLDFVSGASPMDIELDLTPVTASGNFVLEYNYTPIPEPATAALILIAAALGIANNRRRRRVP